jgi:hypothetical protein
MTTMNVLDSLGATVAIEKPLTPGRAAAAASRPVVLSTEDLAALTATSAVTVAAAATNIAKAEDVASADADVGVPAMAVRKATPANTSGTDGDYEMLQMSAGRVWVDASGVTLTVAAHAVTLTAGAAAIAKAEDVASADADVGVPAMAVRKASPANTSGTDGDYEMIQMSAGRVWVSAVVDTALPAGSAIIGKTGIDQTSGQNLIKHVRSATGAKSNVSGSASSVTILASNANRLGAKVWNDSTAILYLDESGGTASATSCTVKLMPDNYYEVPFHYTGAITGIWASATGAARVTEFT